MILKTSNGKEIEYEIIRKNNKNIYFRFQDDLKLYIYAPMYISSLKLDKIIKENEDKILKLYEAAVDKSKDIDKYFLLGKKYYIEYDKDASEVSFNDDKVIAKDDEMLHEYTMKQMYKVFDEEIKLCQKCFAKLPEFTWKTRTMKTRWGVCNVKKNVITLNTELIKKDLELIDYVIIHEMCHFFEQNHGKGFWELVQEAYPNYKEARKRLRE